MAAKRKRTSRTTKKTAKRRTATRKRARKAAPKSGWGGRRVGAGRPVGSGTGPSPDSRRNRIAVMLSDKELQILKGLAKQKKLPLATAVYEFIKPKLRSRG